MKHKKRLEKRTQVNLSHTFGSSHAVKVGFGVLIAVVALTLLYVSLRPSQDVVGQSYEAVTGTPVTACTLGSFYLSDNNNDGFFDEVERCKSNTLGTCTGTVCTEQKTIEVKTNGGKVTVVDPDAVNAATPMPDVTTTAPATVRAAVGSRLKLTAAASEDVAGTNGNTRFSFVSWSDVPGTTQPADRPAFAVKKDATATNAIQASWQKQHKLTLQLQEFGSTTVVTQDPAAANTQIGAVTTPVAGSADILAGGFYVENTPVPLRAVPAPNSGYIFQKWLVQTPTVFGGNAALQTIGEFTNLELRPDMDRPYVVTAIFIKLPAPVLHLSFDDEAQPFKDDSGNNADVFGAGTLTAGKVGNGLLLDGVKDRVRVANIAALESAVGPAPHTIEAWIKVVALPAAPNTGGAVGAPNPGDGAWIARLGRVGNVGSITSKAHAWLLKTDGTTRFGPFGGAVTEQAQPALTVNQFVHVALTYDASTLRTYVNGVPTGPVVANFNLQPIPLIENTVMPLIIGKPLVSSADAVSAEKYFNGIVDEVKVYRKALSADEVKLIHDTALATQRTAVTADKFVWKDEMATVVTADPIIRQHANGPHHHKTFFPLYGAGTWEGVVGHLLQQQIPGTVPVTRLHDRAATFIDVEGSDEGHYQRYVMKTSDVVSHLNRFTGWSDKGLVGYMAPPTITQSEASDIFGGRKVVGMFEALRTDGHTLYTNLRPEMDANLQPGQGWAAQDSAWLSGRIQDRLVGWYPEMTPLGKIFPRVNYPDKVNRPLRYGRLGLTIPGIIQAEDFNIGGEGVATHDADTGNNGNSYRWHECAVFDCGPDDPAQNIFSKNRGVDVTDISGYGSKLGWVAGSEYMVYTVNVEQEGDYDIKAYIARPSAGDISDFLELSISKNIFPYVYTPIVRFNAKNTGSHDFFAPNNQKALSGTAPSFTVTEGGAVHLKQGQYLLKVKVAYAQDSRGDLDNNIDRFEFTLRGAAPRPKVILYDGCGFTAASYEVDYTGEISDLHRVHSLGDTISSVKVENGASVTLYQHTLVKDSTWTGDPGLSQTITSDVDCLVGSTVGNDGASGATFVMPAPTTSGGSTTGGSGSGSGTAGTGAASSVILIRAEDYVETIRPGDTTPLPKSQNPIFISTDGQGELAGLYQNGQGKYIAPLLNIVKYTVTPQVTGTYELIVGVAEQDLGGVNCLDCLEVKLDGTSLARYSVLANSKTANGRSVTTQGPAENVFLAYKRTDISALNTIQLTAGTPRALQVVFHDDNDADDSSFSLSWIKLVKVG